MKAKDSTADASLAPQVYVQVTMLVPCFIYLDLSRYVLSHVMSRLCVGEIALFIARARLLRVVFFLRFIPRGTYVAITIVAHVGRDASYRPVIRDTVICER